MVGGSFFGCSRQSRPEQLRFGKVMKGYNVNRNGMDVDKVELESVPVDLKVLALAYRELAASDMARS